MCLPAAAVEAVLVARHGRPLPLGSVQVQETVLSPTPLLLAAGDVRCEGEPIRVHRIAEAGLASPGLVLREETAQTVDGGGGAVGGGHHCPRRRG